MAVILVSIIVVAAIVLLVFELLPVDLTAIGIMAVLMVLGILSPAEAIAGFANPAPVTVAVLFVVSRGLIKSGALDFITSAVMRLSRGSPRRLLFLTLFLVGGFSSFLNNTPVVVLFISVIMAVCCEFNLSPSKFLMPVSFVSILAGTGTLIGTSTNIIVSDLAAANGLTPIGMFELSILGIPMAMAGAVFLFFAAPRILGDHKEPVCEIREGEKHRYISELVIPKSSPLIGRKLEDAFKERFMDLELYQVIRDYVVLDPDRQEIRLAADDEILVKATAQQLTRILDDRCVLLPHGDTATEARPHDKKTVIAELLVQPNSDAVGRAMTDLVASLDTHVKVLGVKRHWQHFPAEKVRELDLALGDIILVQVPVDHIDQIRAQGDLMVIEDVHHSLVNHRKSPLAMGIFLLMILAATVGLADILVAAMAAMLLMVLTGCLSLREAYRAVDARVLILIVGTIALGNALAKTGAADLYAAAFLKPLEGFSPHVVLSAIILLTSLLSLFISNNSTAVLLLPIALSTAAALDVDPRPFVIGICFGASACYATPIGYQTNLLVYNPGGYRFTDYLKLGIPLTLAVWLVSSIFVPIIWPF